MSFDNVLGGVQSLSNTVSNGLNAANRLGADVGAGLGGKSSYWMDRLRPASFRGVSFGVLEGQLKFGRRSIVHDYPFRDTVWVEDTGRGPRRVAFNAFLVGDDCIAQRDLLIQACEDKGAVEGGELVHPTLGRMTVSLEGQVSCIERWDRGRVFEIGFSFIEQGGRIFPDSEASTGDAVDAAVASAKSAVAADFLSTVTGALKSGLAVAAQAVSSVQSWTRSAQRLVNDATNLYHFVQALPGEFGRLFGGNTVRSRSSATSLQSLFALGAVARVNVAQASNALSGAAAGLVTITSSGNTAEAVAGAVTSYTAVTHGLAAAVAAAAPSSSDSLRVLVSLVQAAPALPPTLSAPVYPITPVYATNSSQAVALMAGSTSDLFRRAALIAMAQTATRYQLASFDDAAAVRTLVADQLDKEITIAADQGQDATYNALRSLQTAIVQDLAKRGADLATLVQVTTPLSVPAPVLAQRLYRDSGRADQLIAEADPVHPAFMPVSFKALAV